jgi:hypothetical protein
MTRFVLFNGFRYQMHAETQINNISVVFLTTPEKFMQYSSPSGAIELFHFSIWIDRRLRLAVQQPTAGNEFLKVHRLVELNHVVIISKIPNRFVRMTFIYSAIGSHAFAV